MKKYLGLLVGLALVLPLTAGAAEFRTGQMVNVGETVHDNVYAAGGTINIVGTIDGDLYVAGGTVNVMGTVTKDINVTGGTVIITGRIGDDLRLAGGNVTVGGSIGGELVGVGGNINVLSGATIAKGAYLGGGTVNMNGSVSGNLKIGSDNIVLGASAKVGGDFDYYSAKAAAANIDAGAKISGATNFHLQAVKNIPGNKASRFPFFAFMTFWGLMGLAGAVVLACLLFYLWREDAKEMIETAFASPGKELLRGFVTLVVMPIAAIVCMITVVGLPLGFLTMAFYGVLIILGGAITGLLWAALLAKFVFKRKETDINWWLIILAVIVLAIIKIIPFIGWLIGFLVFLVGFGVLSNKVYSKLAPRK